MLALIQNGEVAEFPYTEAQFRADNARTSFQRAITRPFEAGNGTLVDVVRAAKPDVSSGQVAVPAAAPTLVNGTWTLGWVVRSLTDEEIAARVPAEVTRLQIRDEAAARQMWATFKAFIEADDERKERWDLAIGISTSDPLLDDMQAALGWTDAQRNEFLAAAAAR